MHDEHEYNYFPPITIGGPTGSYFATCDVTSGRYAEFAIDSVVNGDGGTSSVKVGSSYPLTTDADYSGSASITLTGNSVDKATYFRIPATTTYIVNGSYTRIVNSQKQVFVRVNAGASNSCYVTIRFRERLLTSIPGDPVIVHSDDHDMHNLYNKAREENIRNTLEDTLHSTPAAHLPQKGHR
jgi:hypothetical protein